MSTRTSNIWLWGTHTHIHTVITKGDDGTGRGVYGHIRDIYGGTTESCARAYCALPPIAVILGCRSGEGQKNAACKGREEWLKCMSLGKRQVMMHQLNLSPVWGVGRMSVSRMQSAPSQDTHKKLPSPPDLTLKPSYSQVVKVGEPRHMIVRRDKCGNSPDT